MSVPPGWVSEDAFQAELAALGHGPTQGQLEDWRGDGVIPRPKQLSNFHGSTVWHHPGEARQSLALSRALSKKKRMQFAGEVMWAAGYDVDERYWRSALTKTDSRLRSVARVMNRLIRIDDDTTVGERLEELGPLTGILHKAARRLSHDELVRAGNLFGDIVAGDFERYEHEVAGEGISSRRVALRALGFDEGQNDQILGRKFIPDRVLEDRLSEISQTQAGHNWGPITDLEISEARTDVLNGFKCAVCMHDALAWIYGDQAFGLRMAAGIARTATTISVFGLTLGFARLRRTSTGILSSSEIAQMANQAEMVWLISNYFRDLQHSAPELGELVSAERLKRGFSDSVEHKKLLEELAGYEFPKPVFRPWDQWNKLAKKTMSPGLLAMSIGAPSTLDLAAVVQGASGPPSL